MNVIQIMLHKVTSGMTLAEDIYKGTQLLIPKDTIMDEEAVKILHNSSIISVSVYDLNSANEPTPIEETFDTETPIVEIPKQTHAEKIRQSESFKKVEKQFVESTEKLSYQLTDIATKNKEVDLDNLFESANEIMVGETNTYHLMDILTNIRYFDDSTYAHSMNVALLANIFGRWLHMNEEELKLLTISGLLHDIGKVLIPPEIIKKPGALTSEEFQIIKQHPLKGYQLLQQRNVDERICRAALSHHEKCDGTGYPFGLNRYQISEVAKIITIVDIYEAMTANRCYRNGLCPFDVIKMLEDEGSDKYEAKYLIPFLQGISDTYLHNTVMLNDGRQGEVIMTNKNEVSKPSIMSGNDFIDLTHHPHLKIVSLL